MTFSKFALSASTPQSVAARCYCEAMHAHKRGEITKEELDAIGSHLNSTIDFYGKP